MFQFKYQVKLAQKDTNSYKFKKNEGNFIYIKEKER